MESKRSRFSHEEDQYLKANFLTIPKRILAETMGRSRAGIRGRMMTLGLVLPEEIKKQRAEMSQFRKGHTPFNIGMKQTEYVSIDAIERTKGTRFKKGNVPANSYNEIGKITIRPDKKGRLYKFICLALGDWQPLHRYIWSQHNGPIPRKHMVWFKDQDPMNCNIDNLECITLVECMRRNSASINLPDGMIASQLSKIGHQTDKVLKTEIMTNHKELIQAKRTQLLIDRKIKSLQNGKK